MHKQILLLLNREQFQRFDYSLDYDAAMLSMGSNSGNNVFQFSLQKLLNHPENKVDIDTSFFTENFNPDLVNERYDAVVFSPANIIAQFATMKEWTDRISKLKIPVYAVGLGAQSDKHYSMNFLTSIKKRSKALLDAILNTGGSIGVRGYFTASVLEKMGYHDFDVIGCPSLFMKGANLNIDNSKADIKDFKPIYNGYRFWENEQNRQFFSKYKESIFVCQDEFYRLLYLPHQLTWKELAYLSDPEHFFYNLCKTDRIKLYGDFPSWYFDMKNGYHFSLGCRIHGNVVPILAGVPAVVDIFDSRVRELAEYFNIPQYDPGEQSIDPYELYLKTDYSAFNNTFTSKFEHFKAFMSRNGLQLNEEPDFIEKNFSAETFSPHLRTQTQKDILAKQNGIYGVYAETAAQKISSSQINKAVAELEERFNKQLGEQADAKESAQKISLSRINETISELEERFSKQLSEQADAKESAQETSLARINETIAELEERLNKQLSEHLDQVKQNCLSFYTIKPTAVSPVYTQMLNAPEDVVISNKKVVFVAHEFGLYKGHGGIASYLHNMVWYLLRHTNFEISVIAVTFEEKNEFRANDNFTIYSIANGDLAEKRTKVLQILHEIGPDYVEFADYQAFGLHAVLDKTNGINFQRTVFVTNCHTGTREIIEWGCEKTIECSSINDQLLYLQERLQMILCDYVMAPSAFLCKYIQKNYNINKNLFFFMNPFFATLKTKQEIREEIENFIDLKPYEDTFNVVLVTRFETRKKQHLLIDAFCSLLERGVAAKLFLIGNTSNIINTDEDYRSNIYASIEDTYKPHIYFFDFLTQTQQEKFIAIADLTVMPSVFENQPLAMIESVIKGIPVMASKYSGCRDYTKNDALIFDPFMPSDLADKLFGFSQLNAEERQVCAQQQYDDLQDLLKPEKSILPRFVLTPSTTSQTLQLHDLYHEELEK